MQKKKRATPAKEELSSKTNSPRTKSGLTINLEEAKKNGNFD